MLDSRCENMLCLFNSEPEALEFKRVSLRQLIDREQWQIKQDNAKREADQQRAEYLASFNGFLSSNPMRAGKQLATLEKRFNWRDKPHTRKEIVETLVSEGRFLTDDGLENAEGYFIALNKTEREYSAHCIALRDKVAKTA